MPDITAKSKEVSKKYARLSTAEIRKQLWKILKVVAQNNSQKKLLKKGILKMTRMDVCESLDSLEAMAEDLSKALIDTRRIF